MARARNCQECGNEIPPDDIKQGLAGLVSGTLLCSGCVQQKRQERAAQRASGEPEKSTASGGANAPAVPSFSRSGVIDPTPQEAGSLTMTSGITSFSGGAAAGGTEFRDDHLKRPVTLTGEGATRCRIFHARLNDGALHHMNVNINDWIDENEIEVKQAMSDVGLFAGKTTEQHLVVIIFY
jgi:hypothetical protein